MKELIDKEIRVTGHQKPGQPGPTAAKRGESVRRAVGDEAARVHLDPRNSGAALLEAALERENMRQAWKRVKANKGSAGGDGLSIAETEDAGERCRIELE